MMPRDWLWRRWPEWPWLLGALAGYYLPWIINAAAALTFNAYDLAEWTSLHPAVRGASVPLVAPFLLRAVLGISAVLFAVRAVQSVGWWRWVQAALALWLAITLLPPLDFFRGALDDPNYRQQFALAILTLIGLVLIARLAGSNNGTIPRTLRLLEIGLAAFGIVCSLVGEVMAQSVIRSLQIPAPLGIGTVMTVLCLGLLLAAAARRPTLPEAVNS